MRVPYVDLAAQHAPLKDELLAAVSKVLDHGHFILGDEVAEFERRFAELCGVRYAVGVNSGTDALILALRALGVGPGDEVITAANSFVATASCIALLGARPVFVDVGDDYNMDSSLTERAITPRTRVILPVHLTGRPADMDAIVQVAESHRLPVVTDSAQATCAEYKGRGVGSLGLMACFSLHPLKTLNACGDGGVVTTDDSELYTMLNVLRNHGLETRDECAIWGYNSRLDTLQAAMLIVKLKYVQAWTEKRRENARFYQQRLASLRQVRLPKDRLYERSVYHTFVIEAERRDELGDYLADRGVGTRVHYPVPLHLQRVAASLGYAAGSFPVTERQAKHIISLPVYAELDSSQLEYVATCLQDFYRAEQP